MKKLLGLVLALVMLFSLSSVAFAADMGVQVIGGPEEETEPVNLDDMKMNATAEIPGWGDITLTKFEFWDELEYSNGGWATDQGSYSSGNEADYAIIKLDILNTTHKAKNYLTDVSVKAIYDGDYEYAGFAYQQTLYYGYEKYKTYDDLFTDIDPMYMGHYLVGVTLPNAIVNSKKPLQIVFTIDGNEFTYNVRK